jgi:hypothetical protein
MMMMRWRLLFGYRLILKRELPIDMRQTEGNIPHTDYSSGREFYPIVLRERDFVDFSF